MNSQRQATAIKKHQEEHRSECWDLGRGNRQRMCKSPGSSLLAGQLYLFPYSPTVPDRAVERLFRGRTCGLGVLHCLRKGRRSAHRQVVPPQSDSSQDKESRIGFRGASYAHEVERRSIKNASSQAGVWSPQKGCWHGKSGTKQRKVQNGCR